MDTNLVIDKIARAIFNSQISYQVFASWTDRSGVQQRKLFLTGPDGAGLYIWPDIKILGPDVFSTQYDNGLGRERRAAMVAAITDYVNKGA